MNKKYNYAVRGKGFGSHGQKNMNITPFGKVMLLVLFVGIIYLLSQLF